LPSQFTVLCPQGDLLKPELTIAPIVVSISATFNPSVLFVVGALALSSSATATVFASFSLIICDEGSYGACKVAFPEAEQLFADTDGGLATKLYFQKSLSYELSGSLELETTLFGLTIDITAASFRIEEPDAFNPNPSKSFDDFGRAAIRCFDWHRQLTHPH
jgi:hypothetical protein